MHNKTLTSLNMGMQDIGDDGANAIAAALTINKGLVNVELKVGQLLVAASPGS